MIIVSEEKFEEWNLQEERYQFLFLRFSELFYEKPFESWQVRSTNAKYILTEIKESAIIATKVKVHHTNIKELIDELKETISNDIIINKFHKNLLFYVSQIEKEYKSKAKSENSDFEILVDLAEISLTLLDNYLKNIFDEIENIVLSECEKYKIMLNKLLELLAIEIHNIGYSPSYIQDAIETLKGHGNFEQKITEFRNSFTGDTINFQIFFLIRKGYLPTEIKQTQFVSVSQNDLQEGELTDEFIAQDNNGDVIRINIKCLDKITATLNAKKQLNNYLSLMSLYKTRNPDVVIYSKSLVKNDTMEVIENKSTVPLYMYDSNNPEKNYSNLLSILETINPKDRNYITASMQYFKLSLLSKNDEAKLINLWIALETLFQEESGNIIQKIIKNVSIIVSSKYVNSILRSLSSDIKFYWKTEEHPELSEFIQISTRYYLHPFDLNRILLLNDTDSIYKKLCELVNSNPLLKFRIGTLKSKIYKSAKNMKEEIERHKKNIEWQLRRIYRIRNKIMHQGSLDADITQYYRHLYSYYINTIHTLLHRMDEKQFWSISTTLHAFSINYDCMVNNLEKNENLNSEAIYNFDILKNNSEDVW